jgi:O-antigen ligase
MSAIAAGTGLRYEFTYAEARPQALPLGTGFLCLVGFIVTQAFTIPVAVLPTNWALWPSLPDIFGFGLVLAVFVSRQPVRTNRPANSVSRYAWVLVLYSVLSFVTLTLPQGGSGTGVKYGGFTLLLYFKYVLVAWAASYVPLDKERLGWIHRAALLAFLWVAATSLASRLGILDLRVFTSWLPSSSSGRWASVLDSTVGKQNQTPVAMLLLAGLALVTTDHRKRWVTTVLVIALGTLVAVLTGSRQGVVRFVAFTTVLLAWRGGKLLLGLAYTVLLAGLVIDAGGAFAISHGSRAETALQRQRVLFQDPLTDDALSGRPIIWARTVETLNEHPYLYLTGAGIGSYVEYGGASHNMILQLLLEGGLAALLMYIICYGAMFRHLWRIRDRAWAMVAVTAALLTSLMTSEMFYPTLATGWYLGLYFVSLNIAAGIPHNDEMPKQAALALPLEGRV